MFIILDEMMLYCSCTAGPAHAVPLAVATRLPSPTSELDIPDDRFGFSLRTIERRGVRERHLGVQQLLHLRLLCSRPCIR